MPGLLYPIAGLPASLFWSQSLGERQEVKVGERALKMAVLGGCQGPPQQAAVGDEVQGAVTGRCSHLVAAGRRRPLHADVLL